MRHALKPLILSATITLLLAGCATKPEWTRSVQPVRTLDELYAIQDRVNATAGPYDFGTGDTIGKHTNQYAREMTARRE